MNLFYWLFWPNFQGLLENNRSSNNGCNISNNNSNGQHRNQKYLPHPHPHPCTNHRTTITEKSRPGHQGLAIILEQFKRVRPKPRLYTGPRGSPRASKRRIPIVIKWLLLRTFRHLVVLFEQEIKYSMIFFSYLISSRERFFCQNTKKKMLKFLIFECAC